MKFFVKDLEKRSYKIFLFSGGTFMCLNIIGLILIIIPGTSGILSSLEEKKIANPLLSACLFAIEAAWNILYAVMMITMCMVLYYENKKARERLKK